MHIHFKLFILSLGMLAGWHCQPAASPPHLSRAEGAKLAAAHCGGCHQVPTPDLLDKATWEKYVLPHMGLIMGHYPGDTLPSGLYDTSLTSALQAKGLFPEQPRLSAPDWQEIQHYFLSQAPDELVMSPPPPLSSDSAWAFHSSDLYLSPPSTTLLQIDAQGALWLGDAHTRTLQVLDNTQSVQGLAEVGATPVDLLQTDAHTFVLMMGRFAPNDLSEGYLIALSKQAAGKAKVLISGLRRPVSMAQADFNGDGIMDWAIAEYGKWLGQLRVWFGQKDGSFIPALLDDRAGPAKVIATDWDQDGDVDILALFGQGDEGIWWYENEAHTTLTPHLLRRFPPTYGTVDMGLMHADADARADLWYICGDMADYPPVDKPYHGLYLFQHTEDHHLEKRGFFPMRGAYGLAWGDWDGDADEDLALISFFPRFDTETPFNFMLLKKTEAYTYSLSRPALSLPMGRWLRMASGDLDQDGDPDIALASLAFGVAADSLGWVDRWTRAGIPFVWLENKR